MTNPTSEALLAELKRIMKYDPLTGEFIRTIDHSSRAKAGAVAGSVVSDGYRQICVLGKVYRAHRLAWLYAYGYMPNETVDHINRNRSDNRLSNLRLATKKQNAENIKLRNDNVTGYKGVSWRASHTKWEAKIQHNKKTLHLGFFDSPKEASAAYQTAAKEHFTHI